MNDIHSEAFVTSLFDEMAQTYGIVNIFSSLGFAYFWRKRAVEDTQAQALDVADLMAGGGECLTHIVKRFGSSTRIDLIDWSEQMCERAGKTCKRMTVENCRVLQHSSLDVPVESNSCVVVISTFGLKTLAADQFKLLAAEIRRILRPSGRFSILEFSIPTNRFVRPFFKLYVNHYVPLLGRLFLGNPDNYRMLWRYTKEFGDCRHVKDIFKSEGFTVAMKTYFLGSATHITGCARDRPAGNE